MGKDFSMGERKKRSKSSFFLRGENPSIDVKIVQFRYDGVVDFVVLIFILNVNATQRAGKVIMM